ncbi:hypothetical protein [Embleya sp. NPDC001921]
MITIEVDPALAAQAKESLIACRAAPFVVVGDGLRGYPDGAPYDRLIATMAVQHVPYEWPEQVKPGGVILTPWGTAFHNSGLLRLVVNSDGTASGPFVGSVNFMWARSQRRRFDTREFVGDVIPDPAPDRVRHTTTDPRRMREEHTEFAIGLRLPDVEQRVYFGRGDAADEYTQWLSDGLSWASVDYVPGADKFEVNESGPRDLWAEIETAYDAWRAQGEPAREQHGVTVSPDGQRTWVDGPNRRVEIGPAPITQHPGQPQPEATGVGADLLQLSVSLSRANTNVPRCGFVSTWPASRTIATARRAVSRATSWVRMKTGNGHDSPNSPNSPKHRTDSCMTGPWQYAQRQ